MKMSRFQFLLDARGPDFEQWPEKERIAARALLAGSKAAHAALAQARALHGALAALPNKPAGPWLRSRILEIAECHDQAPAAAVGVGPVSSHRIAACWTAIAASAAIGFAVGALWQVEPAVWPEDLAALVYGAADIDEVLR